ncbi:Na+/H+ antiporter subunit E [Rhodococcoides fascians]|uniref:Na+/H+ antiporter subunit E n=1 Tax=Rhodococcoides fascians TaxID=1828 RepID=UPI00068AC7DE|nr:Na+/H+ antiporter subunit E [Rhodococcus fascians]
MTTRETRTNAVLTAATWIPRIVRFIGWYLKEMALANWSVLADNLTPGQDSTPGIAVITTVCRTEFEITVLASLISLTPGTLTLGTATEDNDGIRTLFVHSMYHDSADELRDEVEDMEHRMLTAVRRQGAPS